MTGNTIIKNNRVIMMLGDQEDEHCSQESQYGIESQECQCDGFIHNFMDSDFSQGDPWECESQELALSDFFQESPDDYAQSSSQTDDLPRPIASTKKGRKRKKFT
jgi:hypothetical protein